MGNISRALQITPLLKELEQKFRTITIVETGTIRNIKEEYHLGDGYSTFYIAKWVKNTAKYVHSFYSVDLDIETAKNFLKKQALIDYVNLVESDSIRFLKTFDSTIHLAYLDSANDPNHIANEFNIVLNKVIKGSIIVIDDAIPESKEVVKIHKVLPYLKEYNFNYQIKNRQCIVRI